MENKKRRIRINLILGIIVVVLIGIMGYCIYDIFSGMTSSTPKVVEVLDKIEGYDYELNENDSSYFESLFRELQTTLEAEELDEEKYATIVGQLFITDFYSLEHSINKNDVGGVQFVYSGYQDDFISKAKTTVYNYVENDIYGDREQVLPVVTNVVMVSIEQTPYTFGDITSDELAYTVTYTVEYEEDLGYPAQVALVLVHSENKLEVAKMN